MKIITAAKTPHDCSFSFSRRYFTWKKKLVEDDLDDDEEILTFNSSSHFISEEDSNGDQQLQNVVTTPQQTRKNNNFLRSALTVISRGSRSGYHSGLGSKLVGTLFGYRRGHVHFAFQEDAKQKPGFLIELAMPTSVLVREMSSGLVRIALECEKKQQQQKKKRKKLVEECVWRTYCNGKKCGYAMKRECGEQEWKVLKAVEPISMGAGVLPAAANGSDGSDSESKSDLGEVMYMRARFERVVGSKDSEAFYMMNADGPSGPELSVYLLRV